MCHILAQVLIQEIPLPVISANTALSPQNKYNTTTFFKYTADGCIICKWFCVNTEYITFIKNIFTNLFYGFSHNSLTPIFLSNIILKLGSLPVYISLAKTPRLPTTFSSAVTTKAKVSFSSLL